MRTDQRTANQLRETTLTPNYLMHAEGSVLIQAGNTKVICAASVEDRVPPFLRNTGKGWVTAEYGMLPRATSTRTQREAAAGKVGGRTQEIQRLIGRSLRSVTHLPALGERTIWVDCDVIQADGGTRTASITGAFVALALALEKLRERDVLKAVPLTDYVAATSVGIVDGEPLLDLAYEDDSRAEVDMNIVKTGDGRFVEVQGTAEAIPFGREALLTLLDLVELAEDDHADLAHVQVERQAPDAVLELEQLVGHGGGQALDPRDAVAALDDGAYLFPRGTFWLVFLDEVRQRVPDLVRPDRQLSHGPLCLSVRGLPASRSAAADSFACRFSPPAFAGRRPACGPRSRL